MNNILQSGTTSRIAALRANTPRGPVAPKVEFLANQANAPMAPMTMYNKGKTIQTKSPVVPATQGTNSPALSPSGLTYAPTQTPMIQAPPVAAPVTTAQRISSLLGNLRNSRFR